MPILALLRRSLAPLALSLLAFALNPSLAALGQMQQPRCGDRPTTVRGELYADNARWCVESVFHDPLLEPLAFTAMVLAPDGTLFATRPLRGEVVAFRDSDGDDLPDKMETIAKSLSQPMGLAYHKGELYAAGGAHIYRIRLAGAVEIIVDDLPSGRGFWTGGITVGDDSRLYVAVGAPCDNCEFDEPDRGAILSLNLDGSDRQIVASGFRQPADVEFYRGQLWTLDSAPRQAERNARDELNRVEPGGWYGFPYCLGAAEPTPTFASGDCQRSIAPVMLFGSGAAPSSLAAFPHDSLPGTKDTLIVVLSGEPSQIDFVGYKVIMISFDAENQPLGATTVIPYRYNALRQAYQPYRGEGLYWERSIGINEAGFGFYPNQPLAVAVHPRGWIFISLTGGRIIALRPRQNFADHVQRYPIWTPMNPDFDPAATPADLDEWQ